MMNIKSFSPSITIVSFVAFILLHLATAQGGIESKFKLSFSVIDESGQPIQGANVWIPEMALLTDVKGLATVSGQSSYGDTPFRISKEGYYESGSRYLVEKLSPYDNYTFERSRLGRWLPWNPTFEVVLKKIEKPIPMYACTVELVFDFEGARGFDLTQADWVKPHGRGQITDIIFHSIRRPTGKRDTYNYKLTVSFPNKGDGLEPFRRKENDLSRMISSKKAPEEGYGQKITMMVSKNLGQMERFGDTIYEETYDRAQHYYFRVRTKLDSEGEIITTNYGKIYQDFMYKVRRVGHIKEHAFLRFKYYLNPTSNDRHMEYGVGSSLIDFTVSPCIYPHGEIGP